MTVREVSSLLKAIKPIQALLIKKKKERRTTKNINCRVLPKFETNFFSSLKNRLCGKLRFGAVCDVIYRFSNLKVVFYSRRFLCFLLIFYYVFQSEVNETYPKLSSFSYLKE